MIWEYRKNDSVIYKKVDTTSLAMWLFPPEIIKSKIDQKPFKTFRQDFLQMKSIMVYENQVFQSYTILRTIVLSAMRHLKDSKTPYPSSDAQIS